MSPFRFRLYLTKKSSSSRIIKNCFFSNSGAAFCRRRYLFYAGKHPVVIFQSDGTCCTYTRSILVLSLWSTFDLPWQALQLKNPFMWSQWSVRKSNNFSDRASKENNLRPINSLKECHKSKVLISSRSRASCILIFKQSKKGVNMNQVIK